MRRRLSLACALAMVVLMVVGATPAAGARTATDRITGTITLEGCTLRPAELTLRAQDLGGGSPASRNESDPDPRAGRLARLSTTGDPHTLRFVIPELEPGRTYFLAIRDVASTAGVEFGRCGRLFWKGPFGGLAVAGDAPVAITGYAARTQLEVFRPETDSWVGADAIDFADPVDAVRTLRWRSNILTATGGELQVSLEPFAVVGPDGTSCDEPADGIIHRQSVPAGRGSWVTIEDVDFGRILGTGRVVGRDDEIPVDPEPDGTIVSDAQRLAVSMGAPLWLRVVPMRSSGAACNARTDGVSGWVNVAKVVKEILDNVEEDPTLAFGNPHAYDAPFFDPKGQPKGNAYSYVVVKPHTLPTLAQYLNPNYKDPLGKKVVQLGIFPFSTAATPSVLQPGDYFWIKPGNAGWWDDLSDAVSSLVTGVIDGIGFLVDSAAKAYASIKAAVLKVITAVVLFVPGVQAACDLAPAGTCEAAIKYGLETAMASAGLPPSLPNWSQVKQGAVDYAAAEIASQAGVPQEVVDQAIVLAQKGLDDIEAGQGGSGAAYNWVQPYFGFDPAVMYVTLQKAGGDLPDNLVLGHGQPGGLYAPDFARIPTHWLGAGDTLRVPMVLQPDLSDVPPPVCTIIYNQQIPCSTSQKAIYFRDAFKARLTSTTCLPLNTSTKSLIQGWFPVTPTSDLAITSVVSVKPAIDVTWGGKFFTNCGG